MFEFTEHHGSVLLLVIQLQALNKVLERSGILLLLDFGVNWVKLLQLDELLALLLGATEALDNLQGWAEVKTTEHITQVEHIHPGLALKVVDVKGKSCPCFTEEIILAKNTFLQQKMEGCPLRPRLMSRLYRVSQFKANNKVHPVVVV